MKENSLVDTHAHLYLEEYNTDIQLVIERLSHEGVMKVFMPCIDTASIEPMLNLELRFPDICHAMIGIHPCYVKDQSEKDFKKLEDWLARRKFVAIGEIGLDYYWDHSNEDEQKRAFERQIQWAISLDLPIIIHSRKSLEDCVAIIKKYQNGKLRGIFHCFSGSIEEAKKIQDLGFLMGIGGVLTYKNAGLKEVVKHISLEDLVLETDAPYLTPVPFRGKRNEPAYLTYIAEALAEAKGISPEDIGKKTTENALKLFGQTI
jgi:TatD DNase family protein